MHTSDRMDFKTKAIKGNTEAQFITFKERIYQ